MGIMATLEGEPPGEPDKYTANAMNRFSRLAGEGGRYGRMRATGPVLICTDHACKHRHNGYPGGSPSMESKLPAPAHVVGHTWLQSYPPGPFAMVQNGDRHLAAIRATPPPPILSPGFNEIR